MDFWLKVELIRRLVPNPKMDIINNEEIIWNDDRSMPTDSELLSELDKYNKEIKENTLYEKVDKLADAKTNEAKNYITGKFITDEQLYRYNVKYDMAKKYIEDGSYSEELGWEASLSGIAVDDLAKLIVQTGDSYKEEMRKYIAAIEAARVRLGQLIKDEKYTNVESIIASLYQLPVTSTIDEIKKVFEDNDGL